MEIKERIEYCIVVFDRVSGYTIKELVFDNAYDRDVALKSYDYCSSTTYHYYEDDEDGEVIVVRDTDYVVEL